MAKTGLTSTQTVTVTRGGASVDVSGWSAEAVAGNVPESLWGDGSGPSLSGTGLVDDRLTGLKITVPAPHLADSLDVAAGVLDLDPITPDGAVPLSASASPAGPVPRTDTGSVATIASGIATDQTTRARNDLYTVLATVDLAPSSNDSMTGYAGLVTHDLAAAPLVATSGA
ncbi:hypothetical protein [Nocardia arthritidis]|uniref:Uncharacterized protein n=1 Tax=Nocardia arthritidis TaxID=228602 RepID=A0A6G9YLI9_9NOCA|nr:hypothetical protein [Nocardia arthritidis]QIS14051.1 hypothetical protein F5544_31045 [Nocardia arthritidis]